MTMSVSSIKKAILSGNNPTTKNGDNHFIKLSGQEYSISTSKFGTVDSAKRDRDGWWDKMISAVFDFFGISTSKRLVTAYNEIIAQPKTVLNESFTFNNSDRNREGENVIAEKREPEFANGLFGNKDKIFIIKYKAKDLEHIEELRNAIQEKKAELEENNVVSVDSNVITYRGLTDKERKDRKDRKAQL